MESWKLLDEIKVESLSEEEFEEITMESLLEEERVMATIAEVKLEPLEEGEIETLAVVKLEPLEEGEIETLAKVKLEPVEEEGEMETVAEIKLEPLEEGEMETVAEIKLEPLEEGEMETVAEIKLEPLEEEGEMESVAEIKLEPLEEGEMETLAEVKVEPLADIKIESLTLAEEKDKKESEKLSKEEKEEFSVDETIKIIVEASIRMNCSMLARTRALVLYHCIKSFIADIQLDIYLVAGSCLDLGIKCCEEVAEFDWMIFNLYDMAGKPVENLRCRSVKKEVLVSNHSPEEGRDENEGKSEIEVLRKSFLIVEILILRILQFDLGYKLAHDYLVYFLNDLREKFVRMNIWDALVETATKIASDFYLFNKCLDFQPDQIAVCAIEFALYLLNVNNEQFDLQYRKQWLRSLTEISYSTELEIMDIIFKLGVLTPVIEQEKTK